MVRRMAMGLLLGSLGCGAAPPPSPAPADPPPAAAAAPARAEPAAAPARAAAIEQPAPLLGTGMAQELEDVTFRQSRGTVTEWELHAATVRERAGAPAHLTGVTLRYFGDEAGPTVITADEADYSRDTQNAVLRGNVHITTATGDSLKSEALDWDAQAETLRTDVEVTLRRGPSFITGMGLTTSPGLEDVEMRQVHGIIHDSEMAG